METSAPSATVMTSNVNATRSAISTPTKHEDFARLCELFDRLATHQPRRTSTLTKAELRSLALPEDLAPVVQNLATVVGKPSPATPKVQDVFATPRKPRLAISTRSESSIKSPAPLSPIEYVGGSDTSEASASIFSSSGLSSDEEFEDVEERKQISNPAEELTAKTEELPPSFTFKMMLHQTYEKEDWAKMVKDALEQSKKEFKPLAEQELKKKDVKGQEADVDLDAIRERYKERAGRLRSPTRAPPNTPTAPRRALSPVTPSRRRARSFIVADTKTHDAVIGALKPPSGCGVPGEAQQKVDARVLKKQCVGRNKSTAEGTSARPLSCWVYDAKISSALVEPGLLEDYPAAPSSPTKSEFNFNALPIPEEREVEAASVKTDAIPIQREPATEEGISKIGSPFARAAAAILRKKSVFPSRRRAMSAADALLAPGHGSPTKSKRPFGL
ncbi:hypothetical protein AX16_004518 [Volvariella volvacea WC 439]|nr:hypothetical protein AX16_004518 [Volvariella volvacea WC 439]